MADDQRGPVFFGAVQKNGNVIRGMLSVAVQHERPGEAEFTGAPPAGAPLPRFVD
jgi:hypothetical protein